MAQPHAGLDGRDVAQHPGQEPDPAPGLAVGPEGHLATGTPGVVLIDLRAKQLSGLPLKLGNVSSHTGTPCRNAGWDASPASGTHFPDFTNPVEGP